MRSLHNPVAAFLAFLTVLGVAGCEITADDIERWKGTVKGPRKIVAVLLAPKYSPDLRARAALALVEMQPRPDEFEGLEQLQLAMTRVDETTRAQLVRAMIPRLTELMRGHGGPVRTNPDGSPAGPTELQTRAKDAAFVLLSYAGPADRQQLTQLILGWIAEDFNGRSLAGNFSAEQVVRAIGQPAAAFLVQALNARMPPEAMEKVTQLIGQLGDDASKHAAAARMVSIEQEMESPAYGQWLAQKVRDALVEAHQTPTPDQVAQVVEHNRDNLIRTGALPAMKHLASQRVIVDRLLQIALDGAAPEARRSAALIAAKDELTRADGARLVPLALNAQTPVDVRDEAFDRIAELRDPTVIPQFVPLLAGEDQRVRWRVAELMLQIGGPQQIPDLFARLPTHDATYPPGELSGIATRIGTLAPLPIDVMRRYLSAPQWFIRVIAIKFFERKGTVADIASLQALASDSTATAGEGWEQGTTVGRVATEAITALRSAAAPPTPNRPPTPAPAHR